MDMNGCCALRAVIDGLLVFSCLFYILCGKKICLMISIGQVTTFAKRLLGVEPSWNQTKARLGSAAFASTS